MHQTEPCSRAWGTQVVSSCTVATVWQAVSFLCLTVPAFFTLGTPSVAGGFDLFQCCGRRWLRGGWGCQNVRFLVCDIHLYF